MLKQAMQLILGVIVTFQWQHVAPGTVKEYILYKGQTVDTLQEVARIPAVYGANTVSYDYDLTDNEPVFFGVAASNNFGVSAVLTVDADGQPVVLGKPVIPSGFTWSMKDPT